MSLELSPTLKVVLVAVAGGLVGSTVHILSGRLFTHLVEKESGTVAGHRIWRSINDFWWLGGLVGAFVALKLFTDSV